MNELLLLKPFNFYRQVVASGYIEKWKRSSVKTISKHLWVDVMVASVFFRKSSNKVFMFCNDYV